MKTAQAFIMGEANRNNELMVFDWNKAAKLIKESNCKIAGAGLRGDWEWTGGDIFEAGTIISRQNTYTYLASTWAVPELEMDGILTPCYIMEEEVPREWLVNTYPSNVYWPQSALDILNS